MTVRDVAVEHWTKYGRNFFRWVIPHLRHFLICVCSSSNVKQQTEGRATVCIVCGLAMRGDGTGHAAQCRALGSSVLIIH